MPDLFSLLHEYIVFFPLAAFICLLLAALNIPISEDLIIISAALVCHKRPYLMVPNLIALYVGVITGDFFVYWVGTRVRKGIGKFYLISRFIPQKALEKMSKYLSKYGILTFIVGRFIPFGVRNTLFFTAGFSNIRLKQFAVYDIVAAMISINTLFFLSYYFGEDAEKPIKIAGIILFFVIASGIISTIIRLIVLWRRERIEKKHANESNEGGLTPPPSN